MAQIKKTENSLKNENDFNNSFSKDLKRRNKFLKIQTAILFLTSVGLLFLLLSYIIGNLEIREDHSTVKEQSIRNSWKAEEREMFYYLSDGDYWSTKKHWKNATYQYKIALKKDPNNYSILYRLTYSTAHLCIDKQVYCQDARKLITRLINHPDFTHPDLHEVQYSTVNLESFLADFKPIDHWSHLKIKKRKK